MTHRFDGDAIWTHDQECSIDHPCVVCSDDLETRFGPERHSCVVCARPLPLGPWTRTDCPRCAAQARTDGILTRLAAEPPAGYRWAGHIASFLSMAILTVICYALLWMVAG